MPEERVDRRLAAIMADDVAGYSRLMSADTAAEDAPERISTEFFLHLLGAAFGTNGHA